MERRLFHDSALRNPDIVARGVLDHIHHGIGLADDVMRLARIVRISRQPDRRPHVEIQSFLPAETAGAEPVLQPLGNHQRLIFPGLRQQNDELIPAIAERKIDESQLGFDKVSNLGQQLASNQMPMRIVHGFEVIQIDEQHAELVAES